MQIRELYFFFIQRNIICAEVSTMISVMSNALYSRCRHNHRRNMTLCKESYDFKGKSNQKVSLQLKGRTI
jgi:hypothetical protein